MGQVADNSNFAPSFAPNDIGNVTPPAFFPSSEPSHDTIIEIENGDEIVKLPLEDTPAPTSSSDTRPPRTFPPSSVDDESTFAPTLEATFDFSSVPTLEGTFDLSSESPSMALEEEIPWNNYLIGLLALESPNSFAALDDVDSPQYNALKWVSLEMAKYGSMSYNQDGALQLFALLCLWYCTGGQGWAENTQWLASGSSECTWYGVTCDESNIVIAIELSNNALTGYIPGEIKLLKELQALVLSSNDIGGTLPQELSTLESLLAINLCDNNLSGSIPADMGDLLFLQAVNVGRNSDMSAVPESFCADMGALEARGQSSPSSSSSTLTGSAPVIIADCAVDCSCCTSCCSDFENELPDGEYSDNAASEGGCCAF